jgi:hypothetical protein
MSNNVDTLEFILKRYDIPKGQKSPVQLQRSRWASLTKLFKELNFTVGAEIGVERGRFSKIICQNNPQLKLYVVDCWQTYEGYRDHVSQERLDEFYLETKTRLEPFNCHFIRDWSMNAVKMFADESLDFVFIDAGHDYEQVKEDIREWSKKVKIGGLVSGHDYIGKLHGITYGVIQAVNEWVEEMGISPLFVFNKDSCPTWMYVKK